MKLDTAIINLLTLHKLLSKDTDPIFLHAIQLGKEALIFFKSWRKGTYYHPTHKLPGETEEWKRKFTKESPPLNKGVSVWIDTLRLSTSHHNQNLDPSNIIWILDYQCSWSTSRPGAFFYNLIGIGHFTDNVN